MLALRRTASLVCRPQIAMAVAARLPAVASFSHATHKGGVSRPVDPLHFNKADEMVMRELLRKVKRQADFHDAVGLAAHVQHDKDGLRKLGIAFTPAQIEGLIKWKHEH
ncbi:hypothetical protein PINS_up003736 [Pythium insidiosum]|nr:hypothetical protein PINS_up003736 [Pythium insidiosum]